MILRSVDSLFDCALLLSAVGKRLVDSERKVSEAGPKGSARVRRGTIEGLELVWIVGVRVRDIPLSSLRPSPKS